MSFILAWIMSCSQYHGAVERLYENPFFELPENQEQRKAIHEHFKTHTMPECLEAFS